MFYVFNKQKIYTYLVSIITVVILFCVAGTFGNKGETIQTSSGNDKLLPIYNVQTQQKKVALTMNCAWSQLLKG